MPLITTSRELKGELEGSEVTIVYQTFHRVPPRDGEIDNDLFRLPSLHVKHGELDRTFDGDDNISTENTPLGTLVSVSLEVIPDRGETSLGFFDTELGPEQTSASVHTEGVESLDQTSIQGPVGVHGQIRTYTGFKLSGTMRTG